MLRWRVDITMNHTAYDQGVQAVRAYVAMLSLVLRYFEIECVCCSRRQARCGARALPRCGALAGFCSRWVVWWLTVKTGAGGAGLCCGSAGAVVVLAGRRSFPACL